MFTGIVTDVGRVRAIAPNGDTGQGDTRLRIATAYDAATIAIGASISCSGACLTVIDKGRGSDGCWFEVEVSAETLARTCLGTWREGTPVNLERAMKIGDELGGHIVTGHVDGLAEIEHIRPEGDSLRFSFRVPQALARYIASKGSIALDGVSLTVNEVEGERFGVNIIPHTRQATTFGAKKEGDRVNVEIDILARYVARLTETAT
jgi:riboflavin synthase